MGIQPKMLDPDPDLIESGSETLLQGYKPLLRFTNSIYLMLIKILSLRWMRDFLPEFIHQTADRASIGAGGGSCNVGSATGGSDLNYRRPLVNSWRAAFTTRFLTFLYGRSPGSAGTAAGNCSSFGLNFWFLENMMRSITNYAVLRIRIRIAAFWEAGSGSASKWKAGFGYG